MPGPARPGVRGSDRARATPAPPRPGGGRCRSSRWAPPWPGCRPAAPAPAPAAEPVRRVLVLSLPGTTWAAVGDARVPHLDGPPPGVGGGQHLGADASGATPFPATATPPSGRAPPPPACRRRRPGLRRRRTVRGRHGRRCLPSPDGPGRPGRVVSLAGRALEQDADRRHRGAEIGVFGETLARAGVDRAVIGNADDALTDRRVETFHREAVLALADRQRCPARRRRQPEGSSGRTPTAAFGIEPRSRRHAVGLPGRLGRAGRPAGRRPARGLRPRPGQRLPARQASEERFRAMFRAALGRADDAGGPGCWREVDPGRDAVVVVAPSDPGDGVHLTVAALRAPGRPRGCSSSASTRRAGFVMQTDLGPHRPRPAGHRPARLHGGAALRGRSPRSWAGPPLGRFVEADREARFRDRMLGPGGGTYVDPRDPPVAGPGWPSPSPGASIRPGVSPGPELRGPVAAWRSCRHLPAVGARHRHGRALSAAGRRRARRSWPGRPPPCPPRGGRMAAGPGCGRWPPCSACSSSSRSATS